MKAYIECPSCKFQISGKMEHTISKGECPSCGSAIVLQEALGVLKFLDVVEEMQLAISIPELELLIEKYFRGVLDIKDLPKIVMEEEMRDKVRRSARRVGPEPEDVLAEEDYSGPEQGKGPVPLFGSKVPGKKLDPNSKFTPEELAEIRAAERTTGIAQRPIANTSNPNRVDSQIQGTHPGDKSIKFMTKSDLIRKGGLGGGGGINYEQLDAEAEKAALAEGFVAPQPVGGSGLIERPVTLPKMPKITRPTSGASVRDPNAVITPRDILGGTND